MAQAGQLFDRIPKDKESIYHRVFDLLWKARLMYCRDIPDRELRGWSEDRLKTRRYVCANEVRAAYRDLQSMMKPWSGGAPNIADGYISKIANWLSEIGLMTLPEPLGNVMNYADASIKAFFVKSRA